MGSKGVQRRLAAILAGDVVAYSRLMEADEIDTLNRLKAHRRELIDPAIAAHHGRIVKTTGDGMLVEFASVVDAVTCAITMQRGMVGRNGTVPDDRRIVFRIGINVGDIVIDGDDIFGDGVNIAARLEELCEPGGIRISRSANEQIRDKLALAFDDLGEQSVKNIARSIGVFGLGASEIGALPEQDWSPALATDAGGGAPSDAGPQEQEIRFCSSADGTGLAYSRMGQGAPLVKTGNWMTHLEFDLESPIWSPLYRELSRDHAFWRYDARGNGLSDRGVADISLDAFVADLSAVVDAAGLERFALFAISQGCAVAISYAVRNPGRVSHLILLGGYALGWNKRALTEADRERNAAMLTLVRLGWGQENPAFRQLFTSQFLPEATKEQVDWFNELQRLSATPEDAVKNLVANGDVDIRHLLAKVSVPTLVMHARHDARVPFDAGRQLAAGIPGARFVPLQSRNHVVLGNEPAFARFLEEIKAFLAT